MTDASRDKPQDKPVATDTACYRDGQAAYLAGKSDETCPYPKDGGRTGWLTGWINAKLNAKLAHIFKRHGVEPL